MREWRCPTEGCHKGRIFEPRTKKPLPKGLKQEYRCSWCNAPLEETMSTFKTIADIDAEDEHFTHRVEDYLRSMGWSETTSTPGFIRLWERMLDGKTVLCDRRVAIKIQRALEIRE